MVKLTCVRHPWFQEAGSRATDIKGEGSWPPGQASSDSERAPNPSPNSPTPTAYERSQDIYEKKGLAKISPRRQSRLAFDSAHGIGARRRRGVPGKRGANLWRRPVGAPSAAPGYRSQAPAQASAQRLGVTNEASIFKKTNDFKKYLAIRFWRSLGERALASLRTRLLGRSPEAGPLPEAGRTKFVRESVP